MGNTGTNKRTCTGCGKFMRSRASEATFTVCGAKATTVASTLLKNALAPATVKSTLILLRQRLTQKMTLVW